MRLDNLSNSEIRLGANVNEYTNADTSLEGEELTITADETELGI